MIWRNPTFMLFLCILTCVLASINTHAAIQNRDEIWVVIDVAVFAWNMTWGFRNAVLLVRQLWQR